MPDDDRLLDKAELASLLGLSRRTIDRMMADGTGPPAIRLPNGRRRWRLGDVRAWVREHREHE